MDTGVTLRIRLFHAAVLIAILSDCTTAAERQYQTMVRGNQASTKELTVCLSSVYNSSKFAVLRAHIPMNVNNATRE